MPLFEFACRSCGDRFEALVTGGRKPECPRCQSTELDKLVSAFGTSSSGSRASGAAASRFT